MDYQKMTLFHDQGDSARTLPDPSPDPSTIVRAVNSHQPPEPTKDELKTVTLHCSTESAARADQTPYLSACVGHKKVIPRWKPGSDLRFAFWESSFPPSHNAKRVEKALTVAVDDWSRRKVVQLRRVVLDEPHVFVVAYSAQKRQHYAEAFFPDSDKRVLRIFEEALSVKCDGFLAEILRHELGHILGLRHDNAGVAEGDCPSAALTPPNPDSIMMSPLAAKGIQESDFEALKMLYSMDDNGTHAGFQVVTIDPYTLESPSYGYSSKILHGKARHVSVGARATHAQHKTINLGLVSIFVCFFLFFASNARIVVVF
ncbi:hypothetical protein B0T26DRAFT_826495 [Lasiosphaeria miniovina]|uniref:Peptidase metallopeptidase domain-containing protein n=1 Tax=Lasiosphaeria miniovina TaxID=1954250 RepID=A0AA40AVA5_9PEZI|nr:uncharacterized protein B0T26DRAFT_826495 [Lasiosphaeria miniovina]KAK0722670.1 hypothetical protein B0T26DRAFT_826495 [Lasiosphaeria miniovina]